MGAAEGDHQAEALRHLVVGAVEVEIGVAGVVVAEDIVHDRTGHAVADDNDLRNPCNRCTR